MNNVIFALCNRRFDDETLFFAIGNVALIYKLNKITGNIHYAFYCCTIIWKLVAIHIGGMSMLLLHPEDHGLT